MKLPKGHEEVRGVGSTYYDEDIDGDNARLFEIKNNHNSMSSYGIIKNTSHLLPLTLLFLHLLTCCSIHFTHPLQRYMMNSISIIL